MSWWVYILRCGDGTLYTGTAADVERRLAAHRRGRGAKYTRGRGPLAVVYREACPDRGAALRREAAIKKYRRAEKEALISDYAERRSRMKKAAFIGTGNIVAPLIQAACRAVGAEQVVVANRTRAKAEALAAELGALQGLEPGAPALVVGLGNRAITPDNIGPKAADQTMVTRHLVERVPEHFGSFRPVAALAAGVLGTTGMESGELVRAVAETLRPACVIAVDALASRSLRRVCRTIQLADTGITPGSGVGNARAALNAETLGVPVIAVGVPTVVDAATLTCDVLAEAGKGELNPAALQGAGDGLIVTPKDIDTQVHDLAKVIGYGINLALHTGLTIGDVELFLS